MAPKSRAAKKEMANPGFRLTLVRGGRRKKPVAKSVKADLQFPVARIGRYLKEGRYAKRIGSRAPIYLTAVLEYLAVELLQIAGNMTKDKRRSRIIPKDLLIAIKSDEEVNKKLAGVTIAQGGVTPYIHSVLLEKKTSGKAAKLPKKTAGKATTSPGKTAVKPANSPEKIAVRAAANSPKKTAKSPGKTAVMPAKSPGKTAVKAATSPGKTAGKRAKSPGKTAVKAANSPKKIEGKAAKSPKKNAGKPAKSPNKTRGSPKA